MEGGSGEGCSREDCRIEAGVSVRAWHGTWYGWLDALDFYSSRVINGCATILRNLRNGHVGGYVTRTMKVLVLGCTFKVLVERERERE